ncbi:GIY-YIG nuclease family protein [Alkalimarinus alittae]|uniref:GIY-YIG nuclease family protein n=1 Tax=Alkalimarinus alittae TaxID=2961619 RepID=A0ABY6N2S9_9ALTE|nr:GIY-YIG nuclease family protein [Alkalimarinus alittae]UZE96417.1 GIY-YIG nuclease family protein [Alkalimarinus alittae]
MTLQNKPTKDESEWWVYLIITESERIYTGIATDTDRRFQEHLATYEGRGKKGAKFFRGHKPLNIIYQEPALSRAEATRREMDIKKLPRTKKWALAYPES